MRNKSLAEYLQRLQHKHVIFIPNLGNAGDALINAATFQFLDRIGLNYQTLSPRAARKLVAKPALLAEQIDKTQTCIILGGGGGFTEDYLHSRQLVEGLHNNVDRLILLPCTIAGHKDLIGQLSANVSIFCREQRTLDDIKNINSALHAELAHDMVFDVDMDALRATHGRLSSIRNWIKCWRSRREINHFVALHGTAHLNAFRQDEEQSQQPLPAANLDLSALLALGTKTRATNFFTAREFVEQIDRFDSISTNRLHICIAASLLGKTVQLFDNGYFKNRAIYQHSLESNPSVQLNNPKTR
ncbi:hypothetical protein FLM48_22055 [Shewanella sp. Scap07]|uniref:polysaccharide pyruvyl transferase family protein n=1 Tax=Shewanella sp. Scap07 TaxID=2589987 RepID=UPI0015BBCDF6|nr:polysaccharide pyruvyl transferase family protein [Shewanella sp. Scap07]QLE87521.1 hypothetical protein FLM48_22055 [Shewanella sp. Scap07]